MLLLVQLCARQVLSVILSVIIVFDLNSDQLVILSLAFSAAACSALYKVGAVSHIISH